MTTKKNARQLWCATGLLFAAFIILIALLSFVDVQAIGPNGSEIGLASFNGAVRDLFGVNLFWCKVTKCLGVFALVVAAGFVLLGLCQLVKRKSLLLVDSDLLLHGVFCALVIGALVFFEIFVVNYRPILVDGQLEPSFPSSRAMLVTFVMGTAICQVSRRVESWRARKMLGFICVLVIAITVRGGLICGMYWFTDILASVLLAAVFAAAYAAIIQKHPKSEAPSAPVKMKGNGSGF